MIRALRTDRREMCRAFAQPTEAAPELQILREVTALALERLRKDPARTGTAKARIAKQILAELEQNIEAWRTKAP
jgi:hypothetical protein